jgi:mono/diheme cytochrome c family protein
MIQPRTGVNEFLRRAAWLAAWATCCALGCHRDMQDQPRYETYEASSFFVDGKSARPALAGTIARGALEEDGVFYRGRQGTEFVQQIPLEIDRPLLLQGKARYNTFCALCHGPIGDANGMIVQRGFPRPPSFHTERLRGLPAGHVFDVISRGFGTMPSYREQLTPRDRWAVVAYLRVLQMSQRMSLGDLTAADIARLEEATP